MFYAVQDHQKSFPEYIHGVIFSSVLFITSMRQVHIMKHDTHKSTALILEDINMSTITEEGRRKQEVPFAVTLIVTVLLLFPSFLSSLILSAIIQYLRIYRREGLISYRQFKLENPCLLKAFLLYRSVVGGCGGLDENGLHSLTYL